MSSLFRYRIPFLKFQRLLTSASFLRTSICSSLLWHAPWSKYKLIVFIYSEDWDDETLRM